MNFKNELSVFNCFKEDSLLSLNPYIEEKRDGYSLLIVPEIGAWCAVGFKDKYIVDFFSKPKTILEAKNKINSDGEIVVDELFYSGILRINNKDISLIRRRESGFGKKGADLPLYWVLKYTNVCNLKCAYCYSYDENLRKPVSIPNEYVYKISDLIGETEEPNILSFCFHGGEPLVRFNDIVKCVDELKRRRNGHVDFSIQTNGTLLNRKIAKFLKQEDFAVGMSIDGYNSETNRLRPYANNKSSVTATLRAIDYCQNLDITPGVISVMTRINYKSAIKTMEELSQRGIKSFHFIHFLPEGRAANKENDYSVPMDELLDIRIKMLLFINDYNAKRDISEHITERLSKNMMKSLTQCGQLSYMCAQSPCGAGREMMALTYEGSIYPCDDFGGNPLFKVGNVNEITDLRETIRHSNAVKLCQSHCIENTIECNQCKYRRICVSHCCSDSYYYTGKFNSPHSSCAFIKRFIPKIIDLLFKGRIQVENIIS